jgi:hypothetical protein
MTTLPSSVTDRSRALPVSNVSTATTPDAGAILHTAGTILNTAHAFLLPLASLFAGLFALGLQVNAVLYGASVFLARGALILVGIWLILYAVKTGFHAISNVLTEMGGGVEDKAGQITVAPELPQEVARPRLALPKDAPAHRYGESLDS